MLRQLNTENLESEIQPTGITIVDFYADWCGPCKMVDTILKTIASNNLATIVKVNIEEFSDIAEKHSIQSLPTMQFYKDGVLVKTQVGALPKVKIEEIIAAI